jgi:hypothetical protein
MNKLKIVKTINVELNTTHPNGHKEILETPINKIKIAQARTMSSVNVN